MAGGKKKAGKKKGKADDATSRRRPIPPTSRKLPTIRQQLSANDPPWMVHEVAADGNCLFRSLHDQLLALGDEFTTSVPSHVELRRQIVGFIERNGAFYSLFMEDDEDIGAYVESMGEDETWGGHVEIHACVRLFGVNVRIFQDHSPAWSVKEWPDDTNMLYVSYHDGNHYNSVRVKASGVPASFGSGVPVVVQGDGEVGDGKEERKGEEKEEGKGEEGRGACDVNGEDNGEDNGDNNGEQEHDCQSARTTKGQCPCGSGKKYRKCCRKRERRAHRGREVSDADHLSLADHIANIDI